MLYCHGLGSGSCLGVSLSLSLDLGLGLGLGKNSKDMRYIKNYQYIKLINITHYIFFYH